MGNGGRYRHVAALVLLSGRQQPAQYALRTRDGRHARDGVFARVHGREA